MSLLNQITVDQLQRISSIENNTIYTASDKKVGVVAVVDGVPIAEVMHRTIAQVNKRYAVLSLSLLELRSLNQDAQQVSELSAFECPCPFVPLILALLRPILTPQAIPFILPWHRLKCLIGQA